MKLAETKSIKVGEKSFPVKVTQRAMNDYERLSGGTIAAFKGSEHTAMLFYATAKAGARSAGHQFKYTYEEFLDVIDDYYFDVLTNFTPVIFELFGSTTEEDSGKKQ